MIHRTLQPTRAVSTRIVIPAKAGRSAQRGEHPKDGPGGVSEANHPSRIWKWIPAFAGMTSSGEMLYGERYIRNAGRRSARTSKPKKKARNMRAFLQLSN
jgi:hypothetical protein